MEYGFSRVLLLAHFDGEQLAGILVDTKNLSSGSPRDKQQATILLVGAGSLGRNGFYNHCKFLDSIISLVCITRLLRFKRLVNMRFSITHMFKVLEVSPARLF